MKYKNILAIDTSSDTCSVALMINETISGEIIITKKNSHSEIISSCITSLITNCQVSLNELDAIAVSAGPGSYTGIRIGYSIAKGLSYALKIPLLGIDTLMAMSKYVIKHHIIDESALLCPMIDARRMEVYTTIVEKNGEIILKTSPIVIDQKFFSSFPINRQVIFFGNGAAKCIEFIRRNNNFFFHIPKVSPKASFLVNYMFSLDIDDVQKVENNVSPIYLKEFDKVIV